MDLWRKDSMTNKKKAPLARFFEAKRGDVATVELVEEIQENEAPPQHEMKEGRRRIIKAGYPRIKNRTARKKRKAQIF